MDLTAAAKRDRDLWARASARRPEGLEGRDDWCLIVPSGVSRSGLAVIYRGARMHPFRLFKRDAAAATKLYSAACGKRVAARTLASSVNRKALFESGLVHPRDRLVVGGKIAGVIVSFDARIGSGKRL